MSVHYTRARCRTKVNKKKAHKQRPYLKVWPYLLNRDRKGLRLSFLPYDFLFNRIRCYRRCSNRTTPFKASLRVTIVFPGPCAKVRLKCTNNFS